MRERNFSQGCQSMLAGSLCKASTGRTLSGPHSTRSADGHVDTWSGPSVLALEKQDVETPSFLTTPSHLREIVFFFFFAFSCSSETRVMLPTTHLYLQCHILQCVLIKTRTTAHNITQASYRNPKYLLLKKTR